MAILNINEVVAKIKKTGAANARTVEAGDGSCKIEIRENGQWEPLITGISRKIAEGILQQATNRVILG